MFLSPNQIEKRAAADDGDKLMSVKTFVQPDSTSQAAAVYPGVVDSAMSVLTRTGDNFAPHAQNVLDFTVALDAGHLMDGQNLVERAAQNTAALSPPTTNPRIDRVVIDNTTGLASIVTGVEAASPFAPTIPAGKSPVAQVLLLTTSTAVTNAMLTDERDFSNFGLSTGGMVNVQTFATAGTFTYTATPGTKKVIVEVQGGGASGGGTNATTASASAASSGGGAGAYARALITSGFDGVTVVVGAGGASPVAGYNFGNNGGTSSFGPLVSSPGGVRGNPGGPTTVGLAGAAIASAPPTGGNLISAVGIQGPCSLVLASNVSYGGSGGSSYFGGGGNAGGGSGPGGAAQSPGAGGGGTASPPSTAARSAGAGAAGIVIVHEYA
jgi:hypothetical protein